jgi:hypothetical protein
MLNKAFIAKAEDPELFILEYLCEKFNLPHLKKHKEEVEERVKLIAELEAELKICEENEAAITELRDFPTVCFLEDSEPEHQKRGEPSSPSRSALPSPKKLKMDDEFLMEESKNMKIRAPFKLELAFNDNDLELDYEP